MQRGNEQALLLSLQTGWLECFQSLKGRASSHAALNYLDLYVNDDCVFNSSE